MNFVRRDSFQLNTKNFHFYFGFVLMLIAKDHNFQVLPVSMSNDKKSTQIPVHKSRDVPRPSVYQTTHRVVDTFQDFVLLAQSLS